MARRFSAQQTTIVKDLQRVMTNISATSLRIEQDVMGGGVKVVFDRAGKRYVRECAKYENSLDNLRVIGLQIEYLYRALEVYAEDIVESSFDIEFDRIFSGFLATPDDTALLLGDGKAPWFEVLGVESRCNPGRHSQCVPGSVAGASPGPGREGRGFQARQRRVPGRHEGGEMNIMEILALVAFAVLLAAVGMSIDWSRK